MQTSKRRYAVTTSTASGRPKRTLLGALFAGAAIFPASAQAALSFYVEPNNPWPSGWYNAAVANMQTTVNEYNAYGDFGSGSIYVYYNSGIPTAQSGYGGSGGSIGDGGTYPNVRVLLHESSHWLGTGTYSNYWSGPHASAIIQQFDGVGAVLNGDTQHYWPYGENYDNESSPINDARHVAMVYALREDFGIGSTASPSSATAVTMTASDTAGTSGFNYPWNWSDGHFPQAGTAYSTGNYTMLTPLDENSGGATPSFNFAGDSLTVNNTNGAAGGLQFQGAGTASVLTFKNLILAGGYVRHSGTTSDLFQIAGNITLSSNPTIDSAQGSIKILANIGGTGSLTKTGPYLLTLTGNGTYTGSTNISSGTLRLAPVLPVASYSFDNVSGSTIVNDGTGGSAMNGTLANGAAIVAGGKTGNAVSLAGGASVDINSPITDLGNQGNWTVSAWVKTTTPGATILTKGDGSTWTTGNSIFYLGDGTAGGSGGIPSAVRYAGGFYQGATNAKSVIDGTWHQVTYVNNSGTYAIYVDGSTQPLSSGNSSFGNADVGAMIRLGLTTDTYAGDGTVNYNGLLDNVQFYSQALSAPQISSLYQGGAPSGTLPSTTAVNITTGAALDLNGSVQQIASLSGTAGSAVKLGSGRLTLNASVASQFGGAISGTGGTLVKQGSGTFTLSGANTYSGSTTISGGTLRLVTPTVITAATPIASYSFGHLSGNTVINDGSGGSSMNGTLDVNGGTGSMNPTGGPAAGMGALVLKGDGTTVDINSGITDLSSNSTWTVSAWIKTTQAGATLFDKGNGSGWNSGYSTFYLGNGNNAGSGSVPDAVRWGGGWVAGSTSVTDGNWHLLTYTDSAGTKTIYVDGVTETISQNQFLNTDTGSVVRIGFAPTNVDGEVPTSGSLSGINIYNAALSPAQVAGLYSAVVGGSPLPATTSVNIATAATLDVNGTTQTVASLNGSTGSSVTLGTGTLTLKTSGTATFSGIISGTGSIAMTGTGTQNLGGNDTFTDSTTVTSGTLNLGANQLTTGILVRNSSGITITNGKLIVGSAAAHSNHDLIAVAGSGLLIGGSTNAWAGTLDLGSNDLDIVNAGATGLATITNQIKQGYSNGAWTGPGIDSTTANSTATHLTALGVILNGTTWGTAGGSLGAFDTINPGSNDVLIKYTYYGDTNLDGQVTSADYTRIDNGYLGSLTGWGNGDFNYDNIINGSDYTLIDNAFNMQGAQLSREIANPTAHITDQIAGVSSVPEPAALVLLLTLVALLGRRRNLARHQRNQVLD